MHKGCWICNESFWPFAYRAFPLIKSEPSYVQLSQEDRLICEECEDREMMQAMKQRGGSR